MSNEPEIIPSSAAGQAEESSESTTLRMIGWFSIGLAVAALGIYAGAELRSRYKFKKRTPYDFYSNAGKKAISEYGVGV